MKMSAAYLEETVAHLAQAGYAVTKSTDTKKTGEQVAFERTRYECSKAPDSNFVLEVLAYWNGSEAYYMELVRAGPIRSFSFPLDSWKYRPSSVEFKYYIHPASGLGLSFILDLSPPTPN
jgi:hypothetical protein